jgi:uncharacterized protein (DUF433 family)
MPPTMAPKGRIEIKPGVMRGKPVIRGTRIPVELILRKLAEGTTTEQLIEAYPSLKKADIKAAKAWQIDGLTR